MKTINLSSLFLITLLLTSCLHETIESISYNSCQESSVVPEDTKVAVYHKMTESWIIPQNDPYTLANFQQAYDNLMNSEEFVTLTKVSQNTSSDINLLEATHYALRMYPRNEEEQWAIEQMQDIKVEYIPFDYVQLPDDQCMKITHETKSTDNTNDLYVTKSGSEYIEEPKYFITYTDLEENGIPIEDQTIAMPILYVVWPKIKELPNNYDYIIDYEVFIPEYTFETKSKDYSVLRLLEKEAIRLALGERSETKSVLDNVVKTLKGVVKTEDNFLGQYVPLENLKIRFKLGTKIYDTYTLSDGTFSITNEIDPSASYIHILQHPRWKITPKLSLTPKSFTIGSVEQYWRDSDNPSIIVNTTPEYYETLPAVNFYYSGRHAIRTWFYESGIRIRIAGEIGGDKGNASTAISKLRAAYITIYQDYAENSNYLNGAILHEFGHFTHYSERGGYDQYTATHKLIRESYASYVGNYLCDRYYTLLGYVNPYDPDTSYTGQARQNWEKTDTGDIAHYSPVFVDLFDSYNQRMETGISSYNLDTVNGFSHEIMRTIAAECSTWDDVRSVLRGYIGTYYAGSEFNFFMDPYTYWFMYN